MSNIQPSDEGNNVCEFVYTGGIDVLYLNITVNATQTMKETGTSRMLFSLMIVAFTSILAVICFTVVIKTVHFSMRTQQEEEHQHEAVEYSLLYQHQINTTGRTT
ncbi:hypothetical protein DPEC_G00154000 [Dallia pectoralis]|uniref:Uncharacterized protein n=1 Tax=Dallia pectoralis TaxID=75939 RepID=A0ACC2GJY9_DALPE|nr:hypothetical protein DPEC_G00154000 [Dallia pectoralis]